MDLHQLTSAGWKNSFAQNYMDFMDNTALAPVRVTAVHRNGLAVFPALSQMDTVPVGGRWFNEHPEDRPTVGDWLVVEQATGNLA